MYRKNVFLFLQRRKAVCNFPNLKSRIHNLVVANTHHTSFKKISDIPSNTSVSTIKSILEKNGCSFVDGFTCISTNCKNCCNDNQGSMYINKTTGFFMCTECQECGNWETIESKINLKPKKNKLPISKKTKQKSEKVDQITLKWNELMKSCKNASSLTETDISNITNLFDLQNFSNNLAFDKLNILYDENQQILYFPLSNGSKRIAGIKQLTKNGDEVCHPPSQCPGIFKYVPKSVTKTHCIGIVVQSIRDMLALVSCKLHCHVICLPHGTVMFPQEILPLLEQYKKLIFWFGNDRIKLDAALMFSKKLGNERCFFIRKTDKSPALYITDLENQEISKIIKLAQPVIHESITTFSRLKADVLSELTNEEVAQGIKWKRFPILNEFIRGHRRGELTVLTGSTGCGKTTFISEYSLDLAMQGVCTLWGSFEIRNQRLAFTMLQQLASVPLNENLDQFEHWTAEFEKLPIYFLKFHGQQEINTVMDAIEHATYVYDIQHVIIDNLQFMMGLSLEQTAAMDRFYKQDKIIDTFRTFATLFNCHVTLIIHPRKEKETEELSISSIFGSAKASQEADNILIIQKKLLQSLNIKKYLQISKNRYSGDLGIMPLEFNKPLLSFQEKKSKNDPSK